jgi:hypothetical protein
MAHNSKPLPSTLRKGPQPVKSHAGAKSVGTHKSQKKIGAARQAAAYYSRKANRDGRPELE